MFNLYFAATLVKQGTFGAPVVPLVRGSGVIGDEHRTFFKHFLLNRNAMHLDIQIYLFVKDEVGYPDASVAIPLTAGARPGLRAHRSRYLY